MMGAARDPTCRSDGGHGMGIDFGMKMERRVCSQSTVTEPGSLSSDFISFINSYYPLTMGRGGMRMMFGIRSDRKSTKGDKIWISCSSRYLL